MVGIYPLQAVLDLRRRQRDSAREALADRIEDERRARNTLARLERRARELERELDQAHIKLYQPAADGTLEVGGTLDRRAEVEHCQEQIDHHRQRLMSQHQAVVAAQQAIDRARAELLEATRALEAIDQHHSRWRQQAARRARRLEERLAEEITTSRFVSGPTS